MKTAHQLQAELETLTMIRDTQAAEILRLTQEVRALRRRQGSEEPDDPLKGLKVAIIGPAFRERNYEDLVESLGARFLFAASDEQLGKVGHICPKAHGVIYITTFCQHEVDNRIDPVIDRLGVPYRKLTFRGIDRLRDVILEMARDMYAYKELLEESKAC